MESSVAASTYVCTNPVVHSVFLFSLSIQFTGNQNLSTRRLSCRECYWGTYSTRLPVIYGGCFKTHTLTVLATEFGSLFILYEPS